MDPGVGAEHRTVPGPAALPCSVCPPHTEFPFVPPSQQPTSHFVFFSSNMFENKNHMIVSSCKPGLSSLTRHMTGSDSADFLSDGWLFLSAHTCAGCALMCVCSLCFITVITFTNFEPLMTSEGHVAPNGRSQRWLITSLHRTKEN